jgi:hypothetical protein
MTAKNKKAKKGLILPIPKRLVMPPFENTLIKDMIPYLPRFSSSDGRKFPRSLRKKKSQLKAPSPVFGPVVGRVRSIKVGDI